MFNNQFVADRAFYLAKKIYLAKKMMRSVAFMAATVFSQPSLATDWVRYRLTEEPYVAWGLAAVSRNQYHVEVFWTG